MQNCVQATSCTKANMTTNMQRSASDSLTDCRYETCTWSYPQWKQQSGQKHRTDKTAEWMGADPAVQQALDQTPTAKVADTAAYELHIQHRLQHLPMVVAHFSAKKYRELRWLTYRKRQSALARLCNTITANSSHTVVGYGDGRFSSKGPTQAVRRRLRTMCRVYDVDEFRTSMLCCACHHRLTGMTSGPQGERSNCYPVYHSIFTAYCTRYCLLCNASLYHTSIMAAKCACPHTVWLQFA